jgi:hypothetical protein
MGARPLLAQVASVDAAGGADMAHGAAGAAAQVAYAPSPTQRHVIDGISGGYDAAPQTGSALFVQDGATVEGQWPVTASGPFYIPCKIAGSVNTLFKVTLAAGGGAVNSYLRVEGHRLEY